MNLVLLVNAYVGASVALLVAAVLLWGLSALNARLRVPFSQRHLLRMGYAFCAAAVLAPLLAASLLPRHAALLPPAVQVWSGTSMLATAATSAGAVAEVAAVPRGGAAVPAVAFWATVILAAGAALMLFRLVRELLRARSLAASALPLRSHGQARVLVSDALDVPFSFWLPGRSLVLVPTAWLLRPADLRMALRHEAQHHRQLDTRLLYALQLLRALFWWHPAAHALVRQLLELQEFACDEAVAGRGAVSREAYCRCLLRAAEGVLRAPPLTAAGILGRSRGALLRRVRATLHPPAARRGPRAAALFAALAVAALGAVAGATATPVHDRRITLDAAERMAEVARRDSSFPIVVNDAVLTELNALLGTPDGRAFLRASLERMAMHRPYIESQLARYGLPRELLAVPLVESGYRNRVAGIGGGLWMFIVPTARRFGLHVSETRDERLDVVLETDAAMRMLSGLHARFGDWPLALLAYNTGNANVEQGIRDTGSTDAFTLIQRRPADAVYLPRVMAAVLVLANPGVVD